MHRVLAFPFQNHANIIFLIKFANIRSTMAVGGTVFSVRMLYQSAPRVPTVKTLVDQIICYPDTDPAFQASVGFYIQTWYILTVLLWYHMTFTVILFFK